RPATSPDRSLLAIMALLGCNSERRMRPMPMLADRGCWVPARVGVGLSSQGFDRTRRTIGRAVRLQREHQARAALGGAKEPRRAAGVNHERTGQYPGSGPGESDTTAATLGRHDSGALRGGLYLALGVR